MKIFKVSYPHLQTKFHAFFFNENEAVEFKQSKSDSTITQEETDSIIFKFNSRLGYPHLELKGTYVLLGNTSTYTGKHDTTWYTSEENKVAGKALYDEYCRKMSIEIDQFYAKHRWL